MNNTNNATTTETSETVLAQIKALTAERVARKQKFQHDIDQLFIDFRKDKVELRKRRTQLWEKFHALKNAEKSAQKSEKTVEKAEKPAKKVAKKPAKKASKKAVEAAA